MKYQIKVLKDKQTAQRVVDFLTGPNAFSQTWAPNEKKIVKQAVEDSLNAKNHRYWYVEVDNMIVAAMGVRENKYGSGGYVMDEDYLAVHKDYRRKGIASQLLKEVEKFVKQQHGRYIHVLSCDISSYAPARSFYLHHGYKQVAEIPNYYVEGEGRVDFFKQLK